MLSSINLNLSSKFNDYTINNPASALCISFAAGSIIQLLSQTAISEYTGSCKLFYADTTFFAESVAFLIPFTAICIAKYLKAKNIEKDKEV